ncbi:uncharacterized protein LOC143565613 [Bidens hawaiensis]|uniref:uncharacterized protein LOC143565613 n=1 Tax=Bidens hawaiensis TaxID=980011 RepID=UPI004049A6A0
MDHQLQTCPCETTTGISQMSSQNQVTCPGKSCQSCTARAIADCVAVCCCPCAVVNFFTLTLLKVPWMMGRKCLDNKSKKKKDKDATSRKEHGETWGSRKVTAIGEDQPGSRKYSARFEAERVWLELYKHDHFGFGRVSFNGIHSLH